MQAKIAANFKVVSRSEKMWVAQRNACHGALREEVKVKK